MIERVSKFVMGLFTMLFVAGAVYAAFVYGSGMAIAPGAKEQPTPTPRLADDRGSDRGQRYATPVPLNTPLNAATAEAWSLSVYKTAVAGAEQPAQTPAARWADALPDCDTGETPCVFTYSAGPAAPVAPNLATGGTNTGSDGNPQKDTDQAATFAGDKP